MNDKEFLKLAIEQSGLSVKQGRFPAGALVVLNDEIIASGISDAHLGYQHAECRVIDQSFQKIGRLTGATLYASMEPCLMCLARAYWAGIRRIVFAINKKDMDQQYYEGDQDNRGIAGQFNEKIEYLEIIDLKDEALGIVRKWQFN